MSAQKHEKTDPKIGPELAQTSRGAAIRGPAKTHPDYWKHRLQRRSYRDRAGRAVTMPEWHVRLFFDGRREWFNLDTANQAAAATKARDVYLCLISGGWDAALKRFKPSAGEKAEVCSVGEFLADVGERSHLRAMTVRRYAVKLRKMVSDIANLEAGIKGKAKRQKYDYVKGGRKAWLAKVDSQSLGLLTPEAVNGWRNTYVARAGADPVKRKSAERSAASYLRCTRALFSPDVVAMLRVKLPPNPFQGVRLKDPGPQRYRSEVNVEWLLTAAERDLRAQEPQAYLALSLCLWAGLRRKEADLLTWEQVDLAERQIHVRRTEFFEPKTEESQRTIDLAEDAVEVLKAFKPQSSTEFVLEGGEPNPSATYDYYRCDCTWRKVVAWMRKKGVKQRKAVHAMRKESGSLIASEFGIEAARQHLGHRDIRTTSAHYVEKKRRIEVTLRPSKLKMA